MIPPNARLACNLARNNRWEVFPCHTTKVPSTPHGFHDASSDIERILELWHEYPAEQIAVATGARSGVSVLDADTYKEAGLSWWQTHADQIPQTRTYASPSGGLHYWFRHYPGLRLSEGRIHPGIDVRADGGYAVYWFAHGCECVDHSPIAPWPTWLAELAMPPRREPPPEPPTEATQSPSDVQAKRALAFIQTRLAAVEAAPEGTRHDTLLRASRAVGGLIGQAGLTPNDAEHQILEALKRNKSRDSIKNWPLARRTITAGVANGLADPMQLNERPYVAARAA